MRTIHAPCAIIPAVSLRFAPMLATAARTVPEGDGWAWEPKLDGWRCMVEVDDGAVTVRTRSGRNITDQVPELAGLADALDGRSAVLDGELVAGDGGRPEDFYRLGYRMFTRRGGSVAFAAFDVLALDGEPLIHRRYTDRRALLEEVLSAGPAWCPVSMFRGDVEAVLTACIQLGLEGAIAKRVDSCYRPGERSPHWRKVKTAAWRANHAALRYEQ